MFVLDVKMPYKKQLKFTTVKDKTLCTVPTAVAQIAELVDMDPDPYFSGVIFSFPIIRIFKRSVEINSDLLFFVLVL